MCFHYDTAHVLPGTVVRDDTEEPGKMIIRLDDGRVLLSTECQYSFPLGASDERRTPRDALRLAETDYLVTSGWTQTGPDDWQEPAGRKGRTLNHGHAVNSQKALDNTLARIGL